MAADGRGLQETIINENFAKMSEALYIADRKAREAIEMRNSLERKMAQREKEKKEQQLRQLAQKARDERGGVGQTPGGTAAGGPPGGGGIVSYSMFGGGRWILSRKRSFWGFWSFVDFFGVFYRFFVVFWPILAIFGPFLSFWAAFYRFWRFLAFLWPFLAVFSIF